MSSRNHSKYRESGVLTNKEFGLEGLLKWVRSTEQFRKGKKSGKSIIDIGFFANVIDIGHGLGLAMTTDGVGTKIIVAEMMNRFDTIGIDCVAMNVNDIICVGAEPVSMLDYIATGKAEPAMLEAIGKGLHEGARQAGINIVGGEISQVQEMLRGAGDSEGLDIVGMCIGTVPVDGIIDGKEVKPGDAIIGLRSSGLHSNGYTLARKCLFDEAGYDVNRSLPEIGRTIGEELLEPTRIYVAEIMEILNQKLPVKALVNITGDGFLNLCRIRARVGFNLFDLPAPQPIFSLIQKAGEVPTAEMYRVFNMGIGFCVIVPDDPSILEQVHKVMAKHGVESFRIGTVTEDDRKRVLIPQKNLVGEGDQFWRK